MRGIDLFFPGVWIHEFAHASACVASGVKVHRMEVHSNAGVVVHDRSGVASTGLIALAPWVVGTGVSLLFFSAAKEARFVDPAVSVLLLWLGFSAGFHAIPSIPDAGNVLESIPRRIKETWSSSSGVLAKIARTVGYVIAWPLAGILFGLIALANATLLVRGIWALGLGVIA